MTKRLGLMVLALIFLAISVYGIVWLQMKAVIADEISSYVSEMEDQNIEIDGDFKITGFPSTYIVHYSGRVTNRQQNIVIEIPALYIQSLFLPGKHIQITLPQGIRILSPMDPVIWSLDSLEIAGDIPTSFPANLTREDLAAWKENKSDENVENEIKIESLIIRKNHLYLKSQGALTIDDAQQPEGYFDTEITGYINFLAWMKEEDVIKMKEAIMAGAILSGLSHKDEETGETVVKTRILIQNHEVFIGPIKTFNLPHFDWPWKNPGYVIPDLSGE